MKKLGTTDSRKYFECVCGEDLIAIDNFLDNDDTEPMEVCISIWSRGHNGNQGGWLKERWHHIKRILKHGHPYTDEIILTPEDLDRLIESLSDYRSEMQKRVQLAKAKANQQ